VAGNVINEVVWIVLVLATPVAFIDQSTTGHMSCVYSSSFRMGCFGWFREHTLGNGAVSRGQVPLSPNDGNIRRPLAIAQLSARPDFSLSATPSLQSTTPGNSTTYSVSVAPVISTSGFYGDILLSVAGLPPGAASTFSPASVHGSRSSKLSISTSSTTPPGNYTLTITARTAEVTHVTQVTLIVSDFSISVLPTSCSVRRGAATSYTVTIAPIGSLMATVKLGLSGLPPRTSSKLKPEFVNNSGTSTLTIMPQTSAPLGSYSLTISGASVGVKHSAKVTLNIK